MKAIKYSILGMGLIAAASLATSCQNHYDEPELQVPVATLVPNTTLAEFKAAFADELAVLTPLKDAATDTHYIIHGRVISSDASGNIYKSLVIQDETAAIALSINQSSMYIDYRLGQDVVIDATGMWMGMYNNYLQLGMLGEYNGTPQITFMAWDTFLGHTQKNGLPNQDFKYINYGRPQPADNPYCLSFSSFSEIPASGPDYINVMSQLVEFTNVSFVDAGPDLSAQPNADGEYPLTTFAPYQDTADRYIRDSSGQELNVRCSGYSSFYADPLPEGVGTVRGILSRYGDSWQLLLRGPEDCIFDNLGTKSEPYSIEQAIAMNDNGRNAWVEGVVVGSVKAGVATVSSIDDILFGAGEAELDNNVVIAPTADCRDLAQMMTVELPYGSRIREWVNLLDNPGVLGSKLSVKGAFTEWLGMHGVTDIASGYSVFEVTGQNIPGITGQGSGTEDDPYTINYIKNSGETEMTSVWVEGYIVGFVTGRTYDTGAVFGSFVKGDYSGNNIVLGVSDSLIGQPTDATTLGQAIPVSLNDTDIRNAYGLKANPDKLGKHVKIFGSISTSFGATGFSSVIQIVELD